MKIKRLPFLVALFLILLNPTFQTSAQTKDEYYSVKNRWSVKASLARYKTAFMGGHFIYIGYKFQDMQMRKMVNFKIEANYGICKFIEIGLFTGFQHYEWIADLTDFIDGRKRSFAPLLGFNANFHILPFFDVAKNCHWDLYLTAKYGGCYLPHRELEQPYFQYGKYRHEYGLGLGIGYYFKNVIGLFAEGSVGKYFYFKRFIYSYVANGLIISNDYTDSNSSFRIGVAAKF